MRERHSVRLRRAARVPDREVVAHAASRNLNPSGMICVEIVSDRRAERSINVPPCLTFAS